MIHDLIEGTVAARDGMVAIPDGPGLGFSVSERIMRDHIKS
jgi:L-alanine-DL-glutamate epimerase-like enolase superfamily enzyme